MEIQLLKFEKAQGLNLSSLYCATLRGWFI